MNMDYSLLLTKLQRRAAKLFFKLAGKIKLIGVAKFLGDLLNGQGGVLDKMTSLLHFGAGDKGIHTGAYTVVKQAAKVAHRHVQVVSELLQRDFLVDMIVNVL